MIENVVRPKTVKFPRPEPESFPKVLRKRVNQYFKDQNIAPQANGAMYAKTIGLIAMYFGPYLAMLIFDFPLWGVLVTFAVMGFGMAGVGMGVMHDAAHGAYHKNKRVNQILGSSIYLISGNLTTWKLQHNVLHHSFTNIQGLDDDLESKGLLRLHPSQPWKKMYRYQHLYAPLVYSLLTLNWVTVKDFFQLIRYNKEGVVNLNAKELRREWTILLISKVVYFTLFPILPMFLLSVSWWVPLLGFVLMHVIAGFTLSFVFQLAHSVDHVSTYDAPPAGEMEESFMEHQLRTTSDFARKSKLLSWYLGGLNFQVEHHLFPHICHIHYPKISEIVERAAKDFGLPFHEHRSLADAIRGHMNSLRHFGAQPVMSTAN